MTDLRRYKVRSEMLRDISQGRVGHDRDLLDVSVMLSSEAEMRDHIAEVFSNRETPASR
jgi:hypothetical protein